MVDAGFELTTNSSSLTDDAICEGISPLGYWQKVNQSPTTQTKPYNTDTYPATSYSNGLIYGYTYVRGLFGYTHTRYIIRGLFPFYTYRLLLLAEMVWITADQSQINLDFSPVFVCYTMWLLRICMNFTKTQKLFPIKILEAAYFYDYL